MSRIRAGDLRHRADVMRPTKALGDRGQLQGQDSTVINEWPCKIEPLTGRKAETERMTVPTATHLVTGYGGGPGKAIEEHYELTGGDLGKRVLKIEHIADPSLHQLGGIVLTCTEVKLG